MFVSHLYVFLEKCLFSSLAHFLIGPFIFLELYDLCSYPRQTNQYHSYPSLCPNHNTEETEVERFYEDLQDLSELTPKKDVLFILGDWNAKVGSQETPGVTGKFGLGMRNEAGQRLIEFCQENAMVIANTLPTTQEKTLHMDITRWSTPKSD